MKRVTIVHGCSGSRLDTRGHCARGHEWHTGRKRAPERGRPARTEGLLGRHVGGVQRHVDQPDDLPHGRALRPWCFTGCGHLRLVVRRVDREEYWGTWRADPAYTHEQSDPHDLAVVVLDEAVTGITPARLPAAGSLGGLKVGTKFTSVGYGAQSVTIDKGPTFHYADIRYVATGSLNAVNPAWLRISMNPATGDGGTCYGDSGGPNFLGDTDILAATTITGDFMCRATNVMYRLDTVSARSFLGQFVTLP